MTRYTEKVLCGEEPAKVARVYRAIAGMFEEHPETWTKGVLARDARGRRVEYDSAKATCWCVLGALHKHLVKPTVAPLHAWAEKRGLFGLTTVNDDYGRLAVIEMLRGAADLVEADQ